MQDPDAILELYDACPECGSKALEALTWPGGKVTVGCWNCEWMIEPTPNFSQNEHAN